MPRADVCAAAECPRGPVRCVMSCAGSPHEGEGRRSRNADGSVPRDIFEVGSQPATPEKLVAELNQVGSTAFQFTVADVPAVLSLLAGISDETDEEGSEEESSRCDPRGDPPPLARSSCLCAPARSLLSCTIIGIGHVTCSRHIFRTLTV